MCYQVLQLTHASSDLQSRQPTLHSYPCCITWCGTATPEERHCRSATLPQFSCGTTTTELMVGSRGYLFPFSSFPTALFNLLLILARQKQKRAALVAPRKGMVELKTGDHCGREGINTLCSQRSVKSRLTTAVPQCGSASPQRGSASPVRQHKR